MNEIKAKSAADYGLTMTENAAKRIKFLVDQESAPVTLRVSVLGGGCSGFQYSFSLDDTENADDLKIERDDAVILIDDMSVSLLQGSEVDFYEGLDGSMFTISNPNATASCGCGTSFAM
jgi:iron-sulfur cluster insertion protein